MPNSVFLNLNQINIDLQNTTFVNPNIGLIIKAGIPFIHDFNYGPTPDGAITDGFNIFIGIASGNFTMGARAIGAGQNFFGSYNTAVGAYTLHNNRDGYYNVAFGYEALRDNRDGFRNTAIGFLTLSSNTDTNENTAIGNGALNNLNGGTGANTAIGRGSLALLTTGSLNTALGHQSGRYLSDGTTPNQTSENCIFIGGLTKASGAGITNENVFGYNTIGNGSNTITLGNATITDTYLRGRVRAGDRLAWVGTTPASLANGDIWIESSTGDFTSAAATLTLKVRNNGVSRTLATVTF
jgi:hypothetical protein